MAKFTSVLLTGFGALWLFFAIPWKDANEKEALSDAMQLEADLKTWADKNVSAQAAAEIFDDGYSLKLGGEDDDRNFRRMILETVENCSVPAWPGAVAMVVGIAALTAGASGAKRGSG